MRYSYGMKKTILALLLIIWPTTTLAADDAFNKETKKAVRTGYELFGGYITDLGIDTTGRMYASTLSSNGIFYSTDAGATWSGSVAGTDLGKVNTLVVSDESDTVYIIGGISLYKTTDGGENWLELTGSRGDNSMNDYNLALGYVNGILVAPVRDGSVDISTDEGATFSNITIAEGVTIDSLAGNSDGSVFYILASTDNDQNRTLYVLNTSDGTVTTAVPSGNYAWVRVKPTDDDFIVIAGADGAQYTTTGVAGTWQTLTDEAITGEVNFIGDRIYLGDKYTDDTGQTLDSLALNANQLAVDPNDNQTIVIGSGTGVNVSIDGGENWVASSEGLLGVTVNDIAQSDGKTSVWLAAQGGLAHSSDFLSDTPTWEYPILPDQASTDLECVWIDPADADHIVAGANNLFVSNDGGETWAVASGVESLTGSFNDIVSDANTLYAAFSEQQGTTGTLYASTDGGVNWTEITGLDAPAYALSVLSNGNVIVAAGFEFNDSTAQRGVFIYDGSTWTQVTEETDQAMTSILVVGETIYAAGIGDPDGKLIQSTDNGATWTDITQNGLPSAAYFTSLATADSDTAYIATGRPATTGYVYKTADAGANWSLFYSGLVDEEFNAMLFDGLTTGTTVGLQTLLSKAKLSMSAHSHTLTITLKDATTKDELNNRNLKLYKKTKLNGKWQRVVLSKSKRKTNTKGKLTVQLDQTKTTYYQARWKPNTNDTATFGSDTLRSDRLKVKGKR